MNKNRYAFSLVEMLVAVILVSLLIGVAIFSFKYQLISIQKTKKIGLNKVIHYNQLRTSIESIKYYVVDDYDMLNYPMKNLHVFFKGNKKEMTYITENPSFSKEIAVAKLSCIDGNLVYQEEPLYGRMDFLRPSLLIDSRKQIFYKNLDKCEFGYKINKINTEKVEDEIPSLININLNYEDNIENIYVSVKSDYNQSIILIDSVMYSYE